jgi:nucleoside-diphosphate-sugar epimerase
MKLAITGGTGFVGSHLIDAALAAGHSVLALTRRPQQQRECLNWVDGSLSDSASLERLIDATDAVIHVAGVLKARDRQGFEAGNVTGTLAVLAAATAGGTQRFVHVSSLAAREPQLSLYGASKAQAEKLVAESGLDWVIVRPPAVYGPGDRETLDLFRMARGGTIYMPPAGKLSLLHVDDLARLLLALAEPDAPRHLTIEPDDGRPGGWTHREFGDALAKAVGMPARTVSTPRFLLSIGSRLDRLLRRDNARLTPDRVAYFCHPDWVASPDRAAPPDLWQPQIPTDEGLRQTADWYRAEGWL